MYQNKQSFIDKFSYNCKRGKIEIPTKLKHILIFGQSRQGKSSLINLLLDKNKDNGASVSDKVTGCTFETEPYWNDEYCFWDTAGLNEQDNGGVMNSQATKNLIKFIKNSQGFHGAIMVVSWSNINNVSTKRNWDLFYDAFLSKRIPVIICITGRGIESAENDQKWIDEQSPIIEELGFVSPNNKATKCVIYSKDDSEISISILPIYKKYKGISKSYVYQLLKYNVTNDYYNPLSEMNWFDLFKKLYNTIMGWFGLINLMVTVREGFKGLLIKLGFSDQEAADISKETY